MSRESPRPRGALVVCTYEHLQQFVDAFARGHLNLLILVGRPGLAKSQSLRQAVGGRACWVEGNATPFGMYGQLYLNRDRLVVIDDVDSLYASPAGVRLLKCLCQTDPVKRVAWQSAAAQLDRDGIPRAFTTTSKVAILANDWRTLNDNVAAVQDRGHVLLFEPTAREVHEQAGGWFNDPEVYAWFGAHLHLIAEPSLRHYVRAAELKRAGLDWVQGLPLKGLSPKALLVAKLRSDPGYPSEEARAQAFVALGGGCRATYFNHARRLRGAAPRPRPIGPGAGAAGPQSPAA
jgi:hypothetical protein